MGKTTTNPLLTGVRGRIGNLVVKQYKHGTVITVMPSYTKRKPTARQKEHRAIFAAAVKFGKAEKLMHLTKKGQAARTESQDIYHKSIQEFMLAVKSIKQNEVNFEKSWDDLSPKQHTIEMINLATSIVTGDYAKKQAGAKAPDKKRAVKKAVVKKEPVKKVVKGKVGVKKK